MMKRRIVVVVVALVALLVSASTTFAAFVGIDGAALASDGETRWTYGGTVIVYVEDANDSTYKTCTGTIDGAGDYSIAFNGTDCPGFVGPVADLTNIFVTASFSAGPDGTPPDYNASLFNAPTSTGTLRHNVSTQSDPTAVSLQNFDTAISASNMLLIALFAVLLIGTAAVVVRRRFEG